MRVGSLFAGIGGFDLGLERAGHETVWQVELDPKCRQVLERHFPNARRHEDVREVGSANLARVDLICGGFPCQDLSVAGRRKGLAGGRSGLWFEFHRILGELAPEWCVIENVPGLLSSHRGRDFAVLLRGLGDLGYRCAWRVLDAQYAGLAQRRKRVFVVGHLGDGRAAKVLLEPESVRWNPAPRREAREAATCESVSRALSRVGGGDDPGANKGAPLVVAHSLEAADGHHGRSSPRGDGCDNLVTVPEVVVAINDGAHHGGGLNGQDAYSGRIIPFDTTQITSRSNYSNPQPGDACHPLAAGAHAPALAWEARFARNGRGAPEDVCPPLKAESGQTGKGDSAPLVGVRRLTPTECARLQGFPDDWLDGQSDAAKYRMLGNAVAVPVAEWIGRRLP